MYLWFLVFALATGLLSGALPAVIISAFKPVSVMKGITNVRFFSRLTLRKILLVTQFVFSMVFIISILLIFSQMDYMINADLGFDSETVYDIQLQGKDYSKVRDQYSQLPEVVSITSSSHVPAQGNIWSVDVRLRMEDEKYEAHCFTTDEYFLETMGLKLIAGRNFPANLSAETESFVLASEMMVEQFQLGSPEEALGTTLILEDSTLVEVIGVFGNFQYAALFLNLRPLLLRYVPEDFNHAFLRLDSRDMSATTEKLKAIWEQIDPDHDMDGDFLDGRIRFYYSFFEDIMYTVGFATLLAIIIAAFGLLGMATYSTRTRLREIGIRKAFGADVNQIIVMVSRSYLWLMMIAALIGGIISYLANNLWLQYLAKSVDFGIGTILSGIVIVVLTGLLTIGSQTLRAARTNPASTLKHD